MCPITNPESIQIFMLLKFSVGKRTRFKTLVWQKKWNQVFIRTIIIRPSSLDFRFLRLRKQTSDKSLKSYCFVVFFFRSLLLKEIHGLFPIQLVFQISGYWTIFFPFTEMHFLSYLIIILRAKLVFSNREVKRVALWKVQYSHLCFHHHNIRVLSHILDYLLLRGAPEWQKYWWGLSMCT